MRLGAEKVHLETIGTSDEADFKIRATGKAFRALIDGLYSDKIGSIVRELCANAFDAQIVGGWEGPFFVHAPNELRPEFYVRDYGIGMDHAKVMDLYTTLFGSDKDETDDLVGAFGLGSKSPFAYSDTFFVSCYDGANVRHYVAAIGDKGTPRIIMQGEHESNEPRGVKVGLSVEADHYDAFADAMKVVAKAYQPHFDSNMPLGEPLQNPLFGGQGWDCYVGADLPSVFNVRQGCVIYPVTSVGGLRVPGDVGNRQYLIDCPIGTIRVTPSRELVEYKPEVVAYIQERIDALEKEVSDLVWEQVKDIAGVSAFFKKITSICPAFVDRVRFVHPVTGLTKPEVKVEGIPCIFKGSFDGDRWNYVETRYFKLDSAQDRTIYLLKDYEPILDPPGKEEGELRSVTSQFSRSEGRRLTRLVRIYAAEQGVSDLSLALGIDWTPEFWAACFPESRVVEVTFDELRNVQARVKPAPRPSNPSIRGLMHAEAPGLHHPLTALPADIAKSAWVESDIYRRRPENAFLLARRFGIEKLYLASESARPLVSKAGLPHLSAFITDVLPGDYTWSDYAGLLDKTLRRYEDMTKVAKLVLDRDPAQYDRIEAMRNPIGRMFKVLRPLVAADLHETLEGEREFVKMLGLSDRDRVLTPEEPAGGWKPSPRAAKVIEVWQAVSNREFKNPVVDFLKQFPSYTTTKQDLNLMVDGLIALSRIIPATHPFKKA